MLYILVVFNKYSILSLGLFKHNLQIEKYYVIFKIFFLSLFFLYFFSNNFKDVKIITTIIILDLFAKLIMFLFQLKLLYKHLQIKTNSIYLNISLSIFVALFFLSDFNIFFIIISLFTSLYYILNIFNMYKPKKLNAVN